MRAALKVAIRSARETIFVPGGDLDSGEFEYVWGRSFLKSDVVNVGSTSARKYFYTYKRMIQKVIT